VKWKGAAQIVAVLAAGAICALAGFNAGKLSAVGHPSKAAVSLPSSVGKASGHGIAVHGWWTLNVFDKGRLVDARQFENSLVTGYTNGGDVVLADLLTRTYPMGPWQVDVGEQGGGSFSLSSSADHPVNGPLTVSGSTPGHVVLHGNYTPSSSVVLTTVGTEVSMCQQNTTAPASCVNYFGDYFFSFTGTTLTTPLSVANGQQVQVTVDISFS
jgi:hypothetical protein